MIFRTKASAQRLLHDWKLSRYRIAVVYAIQEDNELTFNFVSGDQCCDRGFYMEKGYLCKIDDNDAFSTYDIDAVLCQWIDDYFE